MKVAEIVVRILEDEGIDAAFGIPGAAINPVYEYLGQSKQIRHYIARHEEGAAHAADGYYRASGELALAICTSGPAATNFVTGLYTAQVDSIPLICITGPERDAPSWARRRSRPWTSPTIARARQQGDLVHHRADAGARPSCARPSAPRARDGPARC